MNAIMPVPGLEPRPINEDSSTADLIAWSLHRFAHQRLILTTSFGMEGCALIDMYAGHQVPVTVVYLDTMFFFPETHALRHRLAERYPNVRLVNRGTTLTPEAQARRFGAELWKKNPDLCCKLRKVEPMAEVMKEVDVWVTGLRRSQSAGRAQLKVVEWDWKFQVLKINPLAGWERERIWEYIRAHDVPCNVLHEQGYPSVGCTHCTNPVEGLQIGQYSRDGRWSGNRKTECGLHAGENI